MPVGIFDIHRPGGLRGRPPRWRGAAAAVGPGGGGGGIDWGGDTPGYYTKPYKTIHSPDTLYKAPTHYTKPQQTIQGPKTLRKGIKY